MKSPQVAARRLAMQEAEWFFAQLGGKVPEDGDAATRAAVRIDGWLRKIPSFHRGVLALRYAPRTWPTCIADEFDDLASIVVRLECAQHPAVGMSNDALEQASVERLRNVILDCERVRARRARSDRDLPLNRTEAELARLTRRAGRHVEIAIRALAKVRGHGPCVIPGIAAR